MILKQARIKTKVVVIYFRGDAFCQSTHQ